MISDSSIPLVLACLAFLVIFLLFTGILILISRARQRKSRIEKIRADRDEWISFEKDGYGREKSKESGNGFVRFLETIGLKTMPGKSAEDSRTKLKFIRAGLRGKNILPLFFGIKICMAILFVMGSLTFAMLSKKAMSPGDLLFMGFICGMVGLLLPNFWLIIKTEKRKKKIFRAFPDALDLLVVCIEAGMGLDMAINRVGNEIGMTHPELGDELKLLNLELKAGKLRNMAFRSLAQRVDIDDVKNLATLLIQTDRFGTSLAQALRVYADTFRTTRYQRADEIAAKMSTKLIFPLAFCIFPAFFIVAVGPAMIQIMRAFGPK